jgi:hypothetical protein
MAMPFFGCYTYLPPNFGIENRPFVRSLTRTVTVSMKPIFARRKGQAASCERGAFESTPNTPRPSKHAKSQHSDIFIAVIRSPSFK